MFTIIAFVHVIISIFLVTVILMQSAKGHGLAGAFGSFGGGMAQNLFGAQAADVLVKATSVAAALFVATSLWLAVLSSNKGSSIMSQPKKETEQKASPAGEQGQVPAPAAAADQKAETKPSSNAQEATKPAAPSSQEKAK